MDRPEDPATYLAFGGAVVIGGANFVAVSFSNMELPPLFGATLRFALGAAIFVLIARLGNVPRVRVRAAGGAAVYGVLSFGFAYAFLYYALVGLPAGTVAVIVASVPLLTLVIAVLMRQERPTIRGVVGSLLVIAGIGILSLDALGSGLGSSYLVAAILGAVSIAASSVVARAIRAVHPVNTNAVGMVAGPVVLAAGSLLMGETWSMPAEARTWLAVGWLVLLGSVGLFQLFLYVIARWTASATTFALAAMPVVAVALGAIMLGQPVTLEVLVGGSLVIAAVYVGAISRPRASHRTAPTVAPDPAAEATEADR